MRNTENVVGQILLLCGVINWSAFEDLQSLRQPGVEIKGLCLVICDDDIARLRIAAKKLGTSSHGAWINGPQIAKEPKERRIDKIVPVA